MQFIDIELFFATRSHFALQKDYRLNFWCIIYVTEGCGVHFVDFKPYKYSKGDCLFVHKNQVHHFETNDQVKGYIFHINEPFFYRVQGFNGDIFLEFVDKALGSPLLTYDTSPHMTNRILVDLIYQEYNKINEHINVELIATLFQAFIMTLKEISLPNEALLLSRDYETFKNYRQLVEANYKKIKHVEAYAEMMHLSKKTVNQATRKVTGLTAKQFIINRIILEIKRLLSQGELMNYQIADELGFDEAANMTKFFKHYEGISPKEFKNNTE